MSLWNSCSLGGNPKELLCNIICSPKNTYLLLLILGGLFGPKVHGLRDDDEETIQNNERQGLLESTSSVQSDHSDVAVVVPQTVRI